jgi:hypothetical protein
MFAKRWINPNCRLRFDSKPQEISIFLYITEEKDGGNFKKNAEVRQEMPL